MNKYQSENVLLKLLWTTGKWKWPSGAPEGPSRANYHRLAFIDELASTVLIQAWLEGRLTWRKLWRIVSENPGEFEAQLKAVR